MISLIQDLPRTKPTTPSTSTGISPERAAARADCFLQQKAKIDAEREEFRSHMGRRLLVQVGIGTLRGAIFGGFAGAAGGGVVFGVGAVPGAILGAVVGGITGAAGAVIMGGFVMEPTRRALYNGFDYNGAIEQARKYCDAQY